MDAITFNFTELISKVEFSVLEQIFIIMLFTFLFARPIQENIKTTTTSTFNTQSIVLYVPKPLYDLTCVIDVKFQINRDFPHPHPNPKSNPNLYIQHNCMQIIIITFRPRCHKTHHRQKQVLNSSRMESSGGFVRSNMAPINIKKKEKEKRKSTSR